MKETAIVNPHTTIIYANPKGENMIFPRVTEDLPKQSKEIKPHPYGVELGVLIKMLKWTDSRTLQSFLTTEFSRVGLGTAKQICENATLLPKASPKRISLEQAEKLLQGINKTRIMAPPMDCMSPIGSELLEKGLRKEINAEFYAAVTRPPAVYRGNPFIIEVGVAYGGEQLTDCPVKVLRFANRVPLLYQQGACAIIKSVINTAWRSYGLSQSRGAIPVGPCMIIVHIASVWVPFTSESKEAIAHYPEIVKEVKLALQEVGRKLMQYVSKKKRVQAEFNKRSFIERYIPHVGSALQELLGFSKSEELRVKNALKDILNKQRGGLENIGFDPKKNKDFDKELASIGNKENKKDKQLTLIK